jgi:predicted nucleic acid-binding protein
MATTNANPPIFLDTNILIRANIRSAPEHANTLTTLQRLSRAGVELWVSQQVFREYLATVTRQQTFMTPLSPLVAARRIQYFRERFQVAQDNPQVLDFLLKFAAEIPMGGKQIHDANIVATMLAHHITRLLTFNPTDFVRFSRYITVLSILEV